MSLYCVAFSSYIVSCRGVAQLGGLFSKLSLGVPTKDRAHKCFFKLKTLLLYVKISTVILILRWTVAELAFINKEII